MNYILHLETATSVCSAAVAADGKLLSSVSISEEYKHAENLLPLCEKALAEAQVTFDDLVAVAVSAGPGSYTGLRIGVSTAKGICYGLDIPLITVPTLEILARIFKAEHPAFEGYIAPMIDARRMEVYTNVFDSNLKALMKDSPLVIDETAYQEFLLENKIAFIGDGAGKCKEIIGTHSNADFSFEVHLEAKGMTDYAYEAFSKRDFADLAYFEPEYLKPYQGTPPPAGINAGKQV